MIRTDGLIDQSSNSIYTATYKQFNQLQKEITEEEFNSVNRKWNFV